MQTGSQSTIHDEHEYERFLECIRNKFEESLRTFGGFLFTTDATGLFEAFLDAMPSQYRQGYTCQACRKFVKTYGSLVAIDEAGLITPALWETSTAPDFFKNSVADIINLVQKARVTGVFISSREVWGQPLTGPWSHMAVKPPPDLIRRKTAQTAFQAMADKKEDFKTLLGGLREFPPEAVDQAITLLKTDSLYGSERCLGVAEWLKAVHTGLSNTKNSRERENIAWLAAASAPSGFCHIKSTMIGTLLEDIVSGLPFDAISRRFAEKMHPLQYLRPQAPPSAGNIAQAEKIVEQLKAAGSLARRFATLEDLQLLWKPLETEEEPPKRRGIFSLLKPKDPKPNIQTVDIPTITMTWDKFRRTVLPDAEKIEFRIPVGRANYSALVTAVNPDSPPILQWDDEEKRNPVSWYVYPEGSPPEQWGLGPGDNYHNVTGVTLQPSLWDESKTFPHQDGSVFFILDGAKDSRNPGLVLFPEFLKADFHGIRTVIEAFSKQGSMEGGKEASACGIKLEKGGNWNYLFRVTSKGTSLEYRLDRWD